MKKLRGWLWIIVVIGGVMPSQALGASAPCLRPASNTVADPPALRSSGGNLTVNLSYNTSTDPAGRTLYCFTLPDGRLSPTLYVGPGDRMTVNVTNNLPAAAPASAMRMDSNACGADSMDGSSVNIHYHGLNISPACHSDEVIRTLINSGQTFTYNIAFPADEPPGLYWYHPHVHTLAENAVLGGATGAIVVSGIERLQPSVAGLRQRILVVRDQTAPGTPACAVTTGKPVPSWNLTLNYIPIDSQPAVIEMRSGGKEFWRVANAAADTILDLQVVFDGVPQTLSLVALDGVPVGSQDATQKGKPVPATDMRLPPGSRVEFVVAAPRTGVKSAQFITQKIDTGPAGDCDPMRLLVTLASAPTASAAAPAAPSKSSASSTQTRFAKLAGSATTKTRTLYWCEDSVNNVFWVTTEVCDPANPHPFPKPPNPAPVPLVTTTQGSVEDWVIENRTQENHEFHIHQIHFLVLSQDNFPAGTRPVQAIQGQMMDVIETPYWDGVSGHPYPSVKVRMDFRGADIGEFVFHCHILNHEDAGMMAIVKVLAKP